MSEPSSNDPSDLSRNERLEQVLADYLRAKEAGETIDPQLIIAAHPDLADDLRSFFQNHAAVNRLAAPLRDVLSPADTPTLDPSGSSRVAEVGTRLKYFGDYELLGEIARGGMGIVFKAKQTSLGRVVALKMILSGQLASEADVRRFRQEAEAAANLDHPHIVAIYEVGEHQGQHYFSMKLIEGGSLADRTRQQVRYSPRAAAQLIATVARAVHHAHQRGVLHRDLKPANILLDAEGQPHVSDFGLAKRVEEASDLTQSGAVVGTPNYMAPEQAMAQKQLTTAVDVFSLGAILYELLTGQPPFQGNSPVETLLQVMSKEAVSPRSLNRLIDTDLETICLKCLEKEPPRRYDSAAALTDDLERWLRHEPIQARRTSLAQRSLKWARRHPALAALGVCLSLAVASYAVLLTISNARIRESQARTTSALVEARAANQLAERRLYGSQMLLASAAIAQRQPGQARQALAAAQPKLRGWEWNYLQASVDESVQTVQHYDLISVIRFSSDSQRLATLGDYHGLTVFARSTPEQRAAASAQTGWSRNEGHSYPNVALTSDLRRAAIYLPDGLYWWNADNDNPRPWGPRREPTGDSFTPFSGGLQLSADEKRLYVAAENELVCWDVDTEQVSWRMPIGSREALSIHLAPNEKLIALGGDQMVLVYDLVEKKRIHRISTKLNRVEYVRFTADSQNILTTNLASTPQLWRLSDGQQLLKPSITWGIGVAISPDGKLGAHASFRGDVAIFDQHTGQEKYVLRKHSNAVIAVEFSPSGDLLATAGRDKQIEIWNPRDGLHVRSLLGHDNGVLALGFAPDGKTLASIDWQRELKFWNLNHPPRPLAIPPRNGFFSKCAYLRDERTLLLAGQWYGKSPDQFEAFVEVWDLTTGSLQRRIGPHGSAIHSLAVSPDEQMLYTGSDDRVIRLWSLKDGSSQGSLGEPYVKQQGDHYGLGDVLSLAIHPSGKQLVAALRFGPLQSWDLEQRQLKWEHKLEGSGPDFGSTGTVPGHQYDNVQFAEDGEQLVCRLTLGDKTNVQIRSAATGESLFTSERLQGHAAVAVSGDGTKLAYGAIDAFGLSPTEARLPRLVLRDLKTGTETSRIGGYEIITALAWNHAGSQLAVAGQRSSEQVQAQQPGIDLITWKPTGEHETIRIKDHPLETKTLAFLPDGSRLLSGGRDHTVQWWAASDGLPLLSLPLGDSDDAYVDDITISPQGRHVLGAGGHKTRIIWSLPGKQPEN